MYDEEWGMAREAVLSFCLPLRSLWCMYTWDFGSPCKLAVSVSYVQGALRREAQP